MSAEPQFSPAQVLEAGRRAEAEGRLEYAMQFYRHVIDYYPTASEAAAAQSALARLSGNSQLNGRRPPAPPPPPSLEATRPGAAAIPAPLANPFQPQHAPDPGFPPQQPSYAPAPPPAPPQPHERKAERRHEQPAPAILPPPSRDYRTGRALARIFAWLGGFEALLGIPLLAIAVLSPRSVSAVPLVGPLLSNPVVGVWLLFGGLFQLMIGQLVRAVLDGANAAQDLAAVTRAEAEARQAR